jgi:protein SFI1
MTPHHGGDGFDSDYYDVRERVLAETKRSNRQVHYHPGTGGGGYYPEYGEDPAESGYADFKLLAASFRVWVRHAAALRALRIAREAAVENYMISVSFWECQTLKRCLSRWRGRRNVFQLHALRFWYGSNLKMRFLWWREISKFNRVGAQSKAIDAHRKAAMKKAFKGWSIEAAREAALSKCGGSVEAQTLHRIKLMSYVKWRSAFHERIRRREVLERCARRIMQRSLSGAYQAWVHFTLVRLEQKATYERVLEIPKRRHMRIGWFSWRNAFLDRERMRRACRLILNSQIARALRTWKNVVDELVDMRRKCERVIARLQMRAAAGAFARWCEMVDEIQEQRGVLEKAVRTMITQRGLRSAWAKWVEYAEQEIEFREKTGKIIKHFMNRTMAAAWNRWIEFAEHCQLVRMAAKYFVNGTLMRAFQKWRDKVVELQEDNARLLKAVKIFSNRTLAGAWNKWYELIEEKRTLEEKMRLAMKKWFMKELYNGFEAFKENWELNKRLRRALVYFTNAAMLRAFQRWEQFAIESQEDRARIAKALKKFMMAATEGAFRRWEEFTQESIEMRQKLESIMARFMNRTLAGAWNKWDSIVVHKKHMRECHMRALVHYAVSLQGRCFHTWYDNASESARMERVMRSVISRINNRKLIGSWERWHDYVDEVIEARAIASRALAFFTKKNMAGAFARWCDFTEESLELKEMLQKAVNRFMNSAKQAAFDTWYHVTTVELERKRLVIEAVAKRMNRSAGFILKQWYDYTQFELRMRDTLEKAVRLLMNRTINGAFRRWEEKVEEARRLRIAMRKFIMGAVAAAFARWVEYTNDMQLLRKLTLAMTRGNEQLLERYFLKWVDFRRGVKEERANYKAAVLKFFGSSQRKCFVEWTKYTYTMLRVKQILGNGLKRTVKLALRAWGEEAVRAKLMRSKSGFLAANSAAGVGRRSFKIWMRTMRGCRHFRLRHSRSHFTQWTYFCGVRKEDKRREEKLRIVLKQIMFGNLNRMFAGWRLIIIRNKRFFRKQAALTRALANGDALLRQKKRRLITAAWRSWRVDSGKMHHVRKLLGRAFSRAKGTFFSRWWNYVEHRRSKLEKFQSATQLYDHMLQRATFQQWLRTSQELASEMDAKLRSALEFAFGSTLIFTLNKWRAVVQEGKRKKFAMQRLIALLAGCNLENTARHVLLEWKNVCLETQRGTMHLRKADNHFAFRVMDQAFLSWRVQARPLTMEEHVGTIALGSSVWDKDYDDDGHDTATHATVLVRRTRAMFDGKNPDSEDEAEEDVEEIVAKAPATGVRGVLARASALSGVDSLAPEEEPSFLLGASGYRNAGGGGDKLASSMRRAKEEEEEEETYFRPGPRSNLAASNRFSTPSGRDVGGSSARARARSMIAPSTVGHGGGGGGGSVAPRRSVPASAGAASRSAGFCSDCGAAYARAGQKFCMECGAPR